MTLAEIINSTYAMVEIQPEKHDSVNWEFLTKLEYITDFDFNMELPTVLSNLIISKLTVQEV